MNSTKPKKVKLLDFFYGWKIVIAAFIMSFIYSGFYFWAFTLFITPMQEEIPQIADHIARAFFIAGILGAIIAPISGTMFDRKGPKLVVGIGMLFGGTGFALLSLMTEIWQLYVGLSLAGIGPIVIWGGAIPAVANWFNTFRGRALGITTAGLGLGGILTNPSLILIEHFGWRAAFLTMAITIWVVILPLTLILRRRPEDYGMLPDGEKEQPAEESIEGLTFSAVMKSRVFWKIAAIFVLAFWPIGALQVYQSPFMESVGFSRNTAAATVGIMAMITVIGRLGGGWLADIIDPRKVTILSLSLQAIGIIVFALISPEAQWLLVIFLITFGPGFGAITVIQPALIAGYFGRLSFGAISGILWTCTSISFSLAPLVLNAISSYFKDYVGAGFMFFGILSIISAIMVLILPKVILIPNK